MQIITGKYRARKLIPVDSTATRPTLARVKESVFNLIQGKISDSVVLDLFAGSGAFGVECISRGAKSVYFVDSGKQAIKTIEFNTKNMNEEFYILNSDYQSALQKFKQDGIKFDLVYLDPPYKSGYAKAALDSLADLELLAHDACIVVEHQFENDLQNLKECYIIEKSRKYGIAYVDVLTYNS